MIEADLHHEYGLDLLDFFRGQYSWRKLENLIRRLPSWSLTTEAMANDDDLAEVMADQPQGPSTGPRLSEYTPEAARLDVLTDRVGELIGVVMQVAGGNAPRLRPARRPDTALARAEKRRVDKRMGSLVAEVEAAQQRWSEQHN
jgi:hypothetical protein